MDAKRCKCRTDLKRFITRSRRLMGDDDPSVCQHVFDHAKAQRKPEIQPYCFSDNLRRKAVAVVKRGATVVDALLSTAEIYIKVNVTVPSAAMLITEMPELGKMESGEADALTGLAPVPYDSAR